MITKIGVIDSGIGGVTVLSKCIDVNPNYHYIYYSDSLHNPYGDKSIDEIINYSDYIVDYLVSMGCKIIILACNTMSCVAKDYLRNKYKDIDIIAIEPAIKIASGKVLVLGTYATINSDSFKALYNKYGDDRFSLISCSGLADLIENGDMDGVREYLFSNLSKYRGVSGVVLGCTHYPLIKKEIREVLGDVIFYDGSMGIAKRLSSILGNYICGDKTEVLFIDSLFNDDKKKRFYKILEGGIDE